MPKYSPSKFLDNINKIVQVSQSKEKDAAIGQIINSLQRPATEILRSIVLKQKQDVDELFKLIGWQMK